MPIFPCARASGGFFLKSVTPKEELVVRWPGTFHRGEHAFLENALDLVGIGFVGS